MTFDYSDRVSAALIPHTGSYRTRPVRPVHTALSNPTWPTCLIRIRRPTCPIRTQKSHLINPTINRPVLSDLTELAYPFPAPSSGACLIRLEPAPSTRERSEPSGTRKQPGAEQGGTRIKGRIKRETKVRGRRRRRRRRRRRMYHRWAVEVASRAIATTLPVTLTPPPVTDTTNYYSVNKAYNWLVIHTLTPMRTYVTHTLTHTHTHTHTQCRDRYN